MTTAELLLEYLEESDDPPRGLAELAAKLTLHDWTTSPEAMRVDRLAHSLEQVLLPDYDRARKVGEISGAAFEAAERAGRLGFALGLAAACAAQGWDAWLAAAREQIAAAQH